jgi:multicomponent Na+:H+ antiporter subunit D
MHAFGKITLFMSAGAIYTGSKKTEISTMRGLGRAMPWTFGAFLVGALSIIGLPPLGGAWAKLELAIGAAEADRPWLIAVLAISSVLNVAYLVPIAVRGFFQPTEEGRLAPQDKKPGAPALAVIAPCITALGCFLLFFAADSVGQFLAPVFESGGRR